ncbi:uncharacterized protein SOCG_02199 [Schizosaccharomyces octosporus yFS286]|uniref:Uncharacterized protein n=1 Tax=Schizosaccharomyces octosporus (strain yFS286) TaxID=483514 RepID=S9Q3R4_SCHOY|nr:uncharacterized protein SOCG_02199 [Schizosaccharomyces octosporus yFS286]EPX74717.1 hypothetical protein SOCG_02199 [Schizosaccharomyces octosporus yFS286]
MEDFELIRKQEADPYYFHPCLKFEEHIVDGFLSICKAPPPFSFVASQARNKRSVGAVSIDHFPPLINERIFENKKKTGFFDSQAYSSTDPQELPLTFERDTSKARHKRTRQLLLKDKRERY